MQREVTLLKKTFDVWSLKERDWAKDNEILKVSHAHNAEWMQQMQRDMMEMRDIVHSIKADHAQTLKRVAEETAELKEQWDQQTTVLAAKMQEFEAALERHQGDVRALGQQRLDDLDLVEKALSTVQQQQARMRSTVEERVEACEWKECRSSLGGIGSLQTHFMDIVCPPVPSPHTNIISLGRLQSVTGSDRPPRILPSFGKNRIKRPPANDPSIGEGK